MITLKTLKEYIGDFIEDVFEEGSGKSKNTKTSYNGKLNEFNEIMEEIKGENFEPSTLCFDDLQQYIKKLTKLGNKPSSITNKFITVKVFIKYLSKKKVVSKSIIVDDDGEKPIIPRIVKEKAKFLESKEYIQMLQNCKWNPDSQNNLFDGKFVSARNTMLILLILSTGLRRSEALGLKRSEIYDNMINTVGKGGKPRNIPLNEVATNALNEWLKYLDSRLAKKAQKEEIGDFDTDLVFPSNRGQRISDGTYFIIIQKALSTINRAKYIVDENYNIVLDKNGNKIENPRAVRNHSLRKTFASELLHQGVNIEVIRNLLDHSSILTTQIYLGITEKDERDAVNSISMGDLFKDNDNN